MRHTLVRSLGQYKEIGIYLTSFWSDADATDANLKKKRKCLITIVNTIKITAFRVIKGNLNVHLTIVLCYRNVSLVLGEFKYNRIYMVIISL